MVKLWVPAGSDSALTSQASSFAATVTAPASADPPDPPDPPELPQAAVVSAARTPAERRARRRSRTDMLGVLRALGDGGGTRSRGRGSGDDVRSRGRALPRPGGPQEDGQHRHEVGAVGDHL